MQYLARGRAPQALLKYEEQRAVHFAHGCKLMRKVGATSLYTCRGQIVGFAFPKGKPLPVGCRRNKDNEDLVVPDLRTQEGKNLKAEINDPYCPTPREVSREIFGIIHLMDGSNGVTECTIGWHRSGEDYILVVPDGCTMVPLDSTTVNL